MRRHGRNERLAQPRCRLRSEPCAHGRSPDDSFYRTGNRPGALSCQTENRHGSGKSGNARAAASGTAAKRYPKPGKINGRRSLPAYATVAFLAGPLQETLVEVRPDARALARLKARHPGAAFGPLKLRLVRYAAGDTVFALGTTLMEDDGFTVEDLAGIYQARWRIEEHYKTAKWFLAVESFRSESERGVLQELYANFVMVTATRLMTNVIDAEINAAQDHRSPKRVNFKHAVAAVFRNFEALALVQAEAVAETVARIVDDIAAFWQRERPGRSYPRMSLKPARKWTRKGKSSTTT